MREDGTEFQKLEACVRFVPGDQPKVFAAKAKRRYGIF